jgi:hypothetical protein
MYPSYGRDWKRNSDLLNPINFRMASIMMITRAFWVLRPVLCLVSTQRSADTCVHRRSRNSLGLTPVSQQGEQEVGEGATGVLVELGEILAAHRPLPRRGLGPLHAGLTDEVCIGPPLYNTSTRLSRSVKAEEHPA